MKNRIPVLVAVLSAACCTAARAQVVATAVHGAAPVQLPVPPPLRSCVEPGSPQQLLGLQTELMLAGRTLVPAGTPAPDVLPSPELRSLAKLTTARELDLFMVGMMPQASALQEALAGARRSGDPQAVKGVLAAVETGYSGAVKAFILAVTRSYQEGALDLQQLGQARRAVEEYTEQGAFAKEAVEAFFRMEQYARDENTLSYARRNAELLLEGLSKEDLPFRPEPAAHPAQASTVLDFSEMRPVLADERPITDLIVERLKSAVESLRPAPGKEVLLVRLLSNALATRDKFLLVDGERRGEVQARLQEAIRAEAAKAGLQVIFRGEAEGLRVGSSDAVMLSLRHSEAEQEFDVLGWKPRARAFAMEVYLVGARRPSSGLLIPAPQPTPESIARKRAMKRWLVRAGAVPAVAAAVFTAAQHFMPAAAFWSQVPFAGQAAVAAVVAMSLIVLVDRFASFGKRASGVPAWKWRLAAMVMLGLGALAAAKRVFRLAAAGGMGALILAWLAQRKAGRAVASALAFSLITASFGPGSARAMAVAVSAPVQAVPAAGFPLASGAVLTQGPAASMTLGSMAPALGSPLQLPAPSIAAVRPSPLSPVQTLSPVAAVVRASPAVRPVSAPKAAAAVRQGRARSRAVGVVERAQGRVSEILRLSSPVDSEAAGRLGQLFDDSRPFREEEAAVPQTTSESRGRVALAPSSAQETAAQEPPAPRPSWSRSVKFGVALAAVGLLTNVIVPVAAQALGYHFHPNYSGPSAVKVKTLWDLCRMVVAATVMAPVTEEVVFRGVLMGGLAAAGAKAAAWLGGHPTLREALAHWLPALVSSVIFVALHETADPVAFFIRMVTSMLLSEAFHREGLLASIPMHFVNNFVAMAGLVGQVFFGPMGAPLAFAALVGSLALARRFWGDYREQEPEVQAGRIVPQELTPAWALGFAAVSLAGVAFFGFSLKGLVLWSAAAALYAGYAAGYALKKRPPFDYPKERIQ